jgi:preprotein translocase subunit SecG
MEQFIIIVHVLAALAIIGLILLQQGKGAEAGASFGGGASQTVFGSSGGGNFFSRATAIFSLIFFITSFGLAIVAKNKAAVQANVGIPALVEQSAPADVEVPVVEEQGSDVPEVPEQ